MMMKRFLFIPVLVSLFACGNGQQAGAPTEESNAVESVPKLAEMKQASIEYMAKHKIEDFSGIDVKFRMDADGAVVSSYSYTDISNTITLLHKANPTCIVLEWDSNAPKDSVDLLVDGIYTYYKENASEESPKLFFFRRWYEENSGERRYENRSADFFKPNQALDVNAMVFRFMFE